jgi:hypothetical protein
MNNTNTRRDFILKMLLGATASIIHPISAIGSKNVFSVDWPNDFSIQKISNLISLELFLEKVLQCSLSKERMKYSMYSVMQNTWGKRAELFYSESENGNKNNIKIECIRNATPSGAGRSNEDIVYSYSLKGVIQCLKNSYLTPEKWSYESNLFDSDGRSIMNELEFKSYGVIKKDQVRLKHANKSITHEIDNSYPLTFKWVFISLIKSIHENGINLPKKFNVIDEFDLPVGIQELSFARKLSFDYEGRTHTIHSYLVKGNSVIPTVYWANEQGCVFLIISGLEAYFLD